MFLLKKYNNCLNPLFLMIDKTFYSTTTYHGRIAEQKLRLVIMVYCQMFFLKISARSTIQQYGVLPNVKNL